MYIYNYILNNNTGNKENNDDRKSSITDGLHNCSRVETNRKQYMIEKYTTLT